jgi:two-component system sensor histidine kinase AtoS
MSVFTDQLALVLDNAELLARALEVERSLAHAEKLAAIGELAARVAHEIRNPVTAARSLAQQLTRETDDAFHREHGVILTELERVEHQVAALLRFARRDEFRFEPIDLAVLLRSIAEEFRLRCDAAGIDVDLAAATPVVARGDREKLRQVLINLMENAVDALADAPAPRHLGLGLRQQNGSAHLEVRDNGVGVPAEALVHLFEPFFSLKSDGTGLGLSIAKRTIDAHGGRIVVCPNGGTGLAFHIELPLDAGGAGASAVDRHRP